MVSFKSNLVLYCEILTELHENYQKGLCAFALHQPVNLSELGKPCYIALNGRRWQGSETTLISQVSLQNISGSQYLFFVFIQIVFSHRCSPHSGFTQCMSGTRCAISDMVGLQQVQEKQRLTRCFTTHRFCKFLLIIMWYAINWLLSFWYWQAILLKISFWSIIMNNKIDL